MKEFLTSFNWDETAPDVKLNDRQIGGQITQFVDDSIELSAFDVAIIGMCDNPRVEDRSFSSANAIRQSFYTLYADRRSPKILDLGNIPNGRTFEDSVSALSEVLKELTNAGVPTIILGGGLELVQAQYQGLSEALESTSVVMLDERIDLEAEDTFLLDMLVKNSANLRHYSHLAYQRHYSDPKSVDTLESLNYDVASLGDLRTDLKEAEPVMRQADIVAINLSSIRQADAPGILNPTPNGLTGEEICQLSKYAGLSNSVKSFGVYEFSPENDINDTTAHLIAQMMWYFIEGLQYRTDNDPTTAADEFVRYIVKFESNDHELVFWKSRQVEKWWMELPIHSSEVMPAAAMVPCSYKDYMQACQEELPDRWMKAYQKLL